MRRIFLVLAALFALGVLGLVGWGWSMSHPLPVSRGGAEAQARVAALEAAVNLPAWENTGAVSFHFGGRHTHLWDRKRELHRVAFGPNVVMHDLRTREGRAWLDGEELDGEARDAALVKAWALWCNDTFWLNPIAKLRDPGVEVGAVDLDDGTKGILVHYTSGGVTPGDQYLWLLGPDGLPVAWRMWVSIVPIPGIEASWEGWTDLSTGAKVSTAHALGPWPLELTDLKAAATLAELVDGPDPFAPILSARPQ